MKIRDESTQGRIVLGAEILSPAAGWTTLLVVLLIGAGPITGTLLVGADWPFVAAAGVIAFLAILMLLIRTPLRLDIDSSTQEIRLVTATLGGLLPRLRRIGFDDVRRVAIDRALASARPDSGANRKAARLSETVRFELHLETNDGANIVVRVDFPADATHETGLEFFEQVATLLDMRPVTVTLRDARRLRAEVIRGAPVPPPASGESFGAPASTLDVQPPGPSSQDIVPPLDAEFSDPAVPFVVTTWVPGKHVALEKPWHWSHVNGWAYIALLVIGVLASDQIAPWISDRFPNLYFLSQPGMLLMAILVGALPAAGSFLEWKWAREYGVSFNWPAREATFRRKSGSLVVPMGDIKRFELRGIHDEEAVRNSSGGTTNRTIDTFALALVAHLADERIIAVATTEPMGNHCREDVYEFMYAMMHELSVELSVDSEFADFKSIESYPPTM